MSKCAHARLKECTVLPNLRSPTKAILKTFQFALTFFDGEQIEQRLSWMLIGAVAGIDHRLVCGLRLQHGPRLRWDGAGREYRHIVR